MKTIIITMSIIFLIISFSSSSPVFAKELVASIAVLPVQAINETLEELIEAIARESEVKITITVVPFIRSLYNIKRGFADFHLPLIEPPEHVQKRLDYDFSTESIFHVNFVLYTNKNKKIDMKNLKDYAIETDRAHIDYFDFEVTPSSCVECSLKKLNAGRIDGFIFADSVTDAVIRENQDNFKNIHRQLYKVYDAKIVLPKGERGSEIDNMLTSAIQRLREKGELQKIVAPLEFPYDDWQP